MKILVALVVVVVGVGVGQAPPQDKSESGKPSQENQRVEVKQVSVGKNVMLEVEGDKRRVVINSFVCLREGLLEVFLARRHTQEHESILAANLDARDVHTALYLARGKEGRPVQFAPFVPPSGMAIKVTLEYEIKGKKTRVPAQQWVRMIKTKKDMAVDWVFAGSRFYFDPEDPTKVFYGANEGPVISMSNYESALLDVPIESSTANDDLLFEAHTARIPPVDTPVLVILEPILEKPEKK